MNPAVARYFDNAATTPVDERVIAEMTPYLSGAFGNAHSLHAFGKQAEAAVELARARLAEFLDAEDPSQIYFTSGATEANNWLIKGFSDAVISPFEHASLFETARATGSKVLKNTGYALRVEDPPPRLISVMAVNNETGQRWDVRDLPAQLRHADLTQAAGKLPISVRGLDYASLSAHKFYGPKGIGALYSKGTPPPALLNGGEQEQGARSGTLNVPGIVGFAVAAAIAAEELDKNLAHARELREVILQGLKGCSDILLNANDDASPFILSLSFLGVLGEALVIELDRHGFAVSSGAACSARSTEPSHVLTALGLAPEWTKGTVRISTGKHNDHENCKKLCGVLLAEVEKLRTMKGAF